MNRPSPSPAPSPTSTPDARHILQMLEETPATRLADGDPLELAVLQKQFGFAHPLPAHPTLPAEPQAPAIPPPPHEDDRKYTVELTTLDRFISSRRVRKQQAALNRFERDRKAWAEDRTNALAHYEMARKRHAREVESLHAEYEMMLEAWKEAFVTHLRTFSKTAATQ